jgi:hypothetical protein
MKDWARKGSDLRPTDYESAALPLSYEPVFQPDNIYAALPFLQVNSGLNRSGRCKRP